jgi:hypothetical protein
LKGGDRVGSPPVAVRQVLHEAGAGLVPSLLQLGHLGAEAQQLAVRVLVQVDDLEREWV